MQYYYTSKVWHGGSNAYAPTQSYLADDRASFWFSCRQSRPAAASQLHFRTPGLDRNGASRVVRRYEIPFGKSFRNGLLFLVRKCEEHSKSSEMIDDS